MKKEVLKKRVNVTLDYDILKALGKVKGHGNKLSTKVRSIVRTWLQEYHFFGEKRN